MPRIINLYKEQGETPKERLTRHRMRYGLSPEVRLTYLGRLDPLAEGVLLAGEGIDQAARARYCGMDKEYELAILFGVATDTYDVLGLITEVAARARPPRINTHTLLQEVVGLVGEREEPYPPYSSHRVMGKPLFVWAREGKLNDIIIPTHTVAVYAAMCTKVGVKMGAEVLREVRAAVQAVRGDFRQDAVLAMWEREVGPLYNLHFPLVTLRLHVKAGTYLRALAQRLGERLGVPALAYHIVRTRVGRFRIEDAERG